MFTTILYGFDVYWLKHKNFPTIPTSLSSSYIYDFYAPFNIEDVSIF